MECDRYWMFSLCIVPDVYFKLLFASQKGQKASVLDSKGPYEAALFKQVFNPFPKK